MLSITNHPLDCPGWWIFFNIAQHSITLFVQLSIIHKATVVHESLMPADRIYRIYHACGIALLYALLLCGYDISTCRIFVVHKVLFLTHWDRDEMAAFLQTTFSLVWMYSSYAPHKITHFMILWYFKILRNLSWTLCILVIKLPLPSVAKKTLYCNRNKINDNEMVDTKNSSTAYIIIHKLITLWVLG